MKQIIFYLFLPVLCQAQSNACYHDFRNQGLEYMSRKDYGEAISQFVAALVTCKDVPADNDLSQKIEESKRKWAADLQASVTEAQKAYREALVAKDLAENAKLAESEARQKAEENARRAYQRGLRAESYRLALLADMARQQNRKTHAVLLSWMGLQLSDTVQPFVMRAFGEAVRDSFSRAVFNSQDQILSFQFLGSGQQMLIQTSKPAWYLLQLEGPSQITELPGNFTHLVPATGSQLLLAWDNTSNVTVLNYNGKTAFTLTGHTEPIRSACWTELDAHILTCSRDNTARIWDTNGKLLSTLSGHTGNVQEATFSATTNRFLTRSSDGTAKLWTLDGNCQHTFVEPQSMILSATFSGANTVMLQFSNHKIEFRDIQGTLMRSVELEPIYQPIVQSNTIQGLIAIQTKTKELSILNPEGRTIGTISLTSRPIGCSITTNGQVLIWDEERNLTQWQKDGRLVQNFKGHRKAVYSAEYQAVFQSVLSASTDGVVRLWDEYGNVQSEWASAPKSRSAALFTPTGKAVCLISDGGKSVVISPLPADILGAVDRRSLIAGKPASEVKMIYGIQYWEVLER
jgi:hypothetical protein